MASITRKFTYSFDLDTAGRVEELAVHWGVSRTEAVRRAVRVASEKEKPRKQEALEALRSLRDLPKARTKEETENWIREVRLMGEASDRHMLEKIERARRKPVSGEDAS